MAARRKPENGKSRHLPSAMAALELKEGTIVTRGEDEQWSRLGVLY